MSFRNAVIIAMITFVLFIGYMVVVITNESSELIAEDYYEQEQTIDADMAAKQRAQLAKQPIEIKEHGGLLSFQNKSKLVIEKLHASFMCYNDKRGDIELDLKVDDSFPVAQLKKGNYAVELRYQVDGKTYLQQTSYLRK
ncbi:MAG: FixH family protein [Flavobacteriales bacterium]